MPRRFDLFVASLSIFTLAEWASAAIINVPGDEPTIQAGGLKRVIDALVPQVFRRDAVQVVTHLRGKLQCIGARKVMRGVQRSAFSALSVGASCASPASLGGPLLDSSLSSFTPDSRSRRAGA